MSLIILLFIIGILCIVAEVLVPGGILGGVGVLLMFGGCVLAFTRYDVGGGLIALAAALAVTIVALTVEFKILPKTKLGRRAFLEKQISGSSSIYGVEARELIGKTAEALTKLTPSGYVRIDGQRYEAFSQSGQIDVGTELRVVGSDNFRLIVSPIRPS
ncbi:MAG: NfeD family protein [Luteolibacter sp.]|jgi:membrane-bound ClpP family serine protease